MASIHVGIGAGAAIKAGSSPTLIVFAFLAFTAVFFAEDFLAALALGVAVFLATFFFAASNTVGKVVI